MVASTSDEVPEYLEGLYDHIKQAFKNNEDRYGKFTYNHYKVLTRGLLKVYQAMERTITKRMILDSFKVAGIAPYDIDTIIGNCFADLKRPQQLNIKRNIEWLSRKIEENGELCVADYENCGIADNIDRGNHMMPEQLVLWRRRFLILSHDQVFTREMEYRARKAQEIFDKEKRRLDRIAAAAVREANKKRKAEAKRAREEAKSIERERVAANNAQRKRKREEKNSEVAL